MVLLLVLWLSGCQSARWKRFERIYNRGGIALRMCRFQDAVKHFKMASEIAVSIPNAKAYIRKAYAEENIGKAYSRLGEYEESIRHLTGAAAIQPDADERLRVNMQIADAYFRRGDIRQSRVLLNELSQATSDVKLKSQIFNYLGLTYHRQLSFDTSLQYYNMAKGWAERLKQPERNAALLPVCQNLSALYALYNDFQAAQQALNNLPSSSDDILVASEILETRGVLFLKQKKYEEAERCLLQSRRMKKQLHKCEQDYLLLYIGDLYFNQGRLDQSAVYYDSCFQIFNNSEDYGLQYSTLARMGFQENALHRPQKALKYFDHIGALLHKHPTDDTELYIALYAGLARAYELLGQHDWAMTYYTKTAVLLEKSRELIQKSNIRQLFLHSRTGVYESLVKLLYSQYERALATGHDGFSFADSAIYYAEKSKFRVLAEILAVKSEREFVQFSGKETCSSIDQILQRPEELIIEYEITDSATFIFVIRDKKLLDWIEADISRTTLQKQCSQLRDAILKISDGPSARQTFAEQSHELYLTLASGWVKYVQPGDKVIIIPDEYLSNIPFEALVEQTDIKNNGNETTYLLQNTDCAISYYPSATLIISNRSKIKHQNHHKSLLAYGVSITNNNKCCSKALPSTFAEAEADTLVSICSSYGEKIQIMQGHGATEQSFKNLELNGFDLIHLSTHGYLTHNNCASQPFLRFNDDADSAEDGCLMLNEIYQLELNADLVTLSACDSGQGELIQGEGLTGMAHAFFAAGAKSLIVTQWSVFDRSTLQLMIVFYHNICNGIDRSTALRMAKERLRKDQIRIDGQTIFYNAPFYWAPFVLIGEYD